MTMLGYHSVKLGHVAAFTVTTVVCFLGVGRAERMPDADTRRGLSSLLVLSGAWAGAHVGRLLVPGERPKIVFYIVGLLVGFTTVLAWLYFCSAYTGHDYHHDRTLRRVGLGLLVAVFALKITNPLHNLYFSTAVATEPFVHLVVHQMTIHWVITGLVYALSAVGFYLLYELFEEVDYDARRLGALVGLTAVPVVLDVVGYASPGVLIGLNYEPLGVAAFAVGALFVFEDSFLAVPRLGRRQLIQELDDAVVFLDSEGRVRKYNETAGETFPALRGAAGRTLADCLPEVAAFLGSDAETFETTVDGRERHYVVVENHLTAGETTVGRLLLFTDVTRVERQREELERQYEQFDRFAAAMDHELRNALTVVRGNLELAGDVTDDPESAREHLSRIGESTGRIERVVSQLSQFARYQDADPELAPLVFHEEVTGAWRTAGVEGVELTVSGEGQIRTEGARFRDLLGSFFKFAEENDATAVWIERRPDGFSMTENGAETAVAQPEAAFEYGIPVPSAGTGMALPNVRTLAQMLDWEATVDTDYTDGVRILVTGVTDGESCSGGE